MSHLDNFFNLRTDKQEHIINAALTVFGQNGYKKTSTADIAQEAGIAKGMVFYYFGSKKNLYLYLVELCGKEWVEEMERHFDTSITDFFDKIKMMTDIKIALMKRHPASVSFFTKVFYETDKEVLAELERFKADGAHIRMRWVFDDTDVSRFKDDVDPELLTRFLTWAGEGFANSLSADDAIDKIDAFVEEFYECLDMMKAHFYKT